MPGSQNKTDGCAPIRLIPSPQHIGFLQLLTPPVKMFLGQMTVLTGTLTVKYEGKTRKCRGFFKKIVVVLSFINLKTRFNSIRLIFNTRTNLIMNKSKICLKLTAFCVFVDVPDTFTSG